MSITWGQVPSAVPGVTSSPAGNAIAPSAPNLSAAQTGIPSTSAPTNALSPEGFAQNFNSGAQSGGPMAAGTEGLSSNAAHAMQPQAPIHPEGMAAPPAYTAPTAGAPLFENAHATPTYEAPQAPVAPPADTTQAYVAGPAAQAPVMPSTAAPAAPAGPLPTYGADLRPAAATAPAAQPVTPPAAAPASAPVHPSSGNALNQPAVVRQTPAAAGAAVQPPTGIKLLVPRLRSKTLEGLLGETTLSATYAPGQYLPAAEDTDPTQMSIRARDLHKVDELGWELAQATKWRDGLPRLAHTLAKAASTGSAAVKAAQVETELPQFEWTPEIAGPRVLLEGCRDVSNSSVVYTGVQSGGCSAGD
ncbi:DUF5631 domain-containing protein [Mycolicibacterium sarraceniae]|uniref:DUF5631 domain-containing protein n=1 Tax=Mycolicibacterium sarraceniae TaxID=1534348 RepID=A0A7I7SQ53_9MYCO|nr:DUF5631 domain-containing protein [Mycolicibacterium sarraceniae]BBY58883.1 hypothetical protein MSAR_20190 [Mycolicibacterium sarraceniae]